MSITVGRAALAMLLVAGLLTACSSSKESRMEKARQQQAKAMDSHDRPLPERLMKSTIVVQVDADGGITVQGEPLGEDQDLDVAIKSHLVKEQKNWPVTVLIDPRQSVALLEPVVSAANKARPGLVSVIQYETGVTEEHPG